MGLEGEVGGEVGALEMFDERKWWIGFNDRETS